MVKGLFKGLEGKRVLALDISYKSTGVVVWDGGTLKTDCWELRHSSLSGTALRRDFGSLLRTLAGSDSWDAVIVEKTILGVNYKTTKVLIELGTVPEDLVYDKVFGENVELKYVDNKVWKRTLREKSGIGKGINSKSDISEALRLLGFDVEGVVEDILDAVGLLIHYADSVSNTGQKVAVSGTVTKKKGFKVICVDYLPSGEFLGGKCRGSYSTVVKRVDDGVSSYYFDIGEGVALGVDAEKYHLPLYSDKRYLWFKR